MPREEGEEAADEPVGVVVGGGGGEQMPKPPGLAKQGRRSSRHSPQVGQLAAGGLIGEMGDVLPTEDLDSRQVAAGGHDLAGDHLPGIGEVVLLARPAVGERDQEGVAGPAAGPAARCT